MQNLPFMLFYNEKRHWHHNNFCHKDNWKHKARLKINSHFNFKSVSRCRTATKLLICCAREQPDQSYLAVQCCRGVKVFCEWHHAKAKEKAVVFAGGRNIAGLLQTEHHFGQKPSSFVAATATHKDLLLTGTACHLGNPHRSCCLIAA